MTDIAERIKALRRGRGWRLEDLEEATAQAGRRVSHKTIANIERKRNPRVGNEILMAIVAAFGLTMEEFMRPDEEEEPLPAQALALTDRLLSQDAERSEEGAAVYQHWLESAARKRLVALAEEQSRPTVKPPRGGRVANATPERRRT